VSARQNLRVKGEKKKRLLGGRKKRTIGGTKVRVPRVAAKGVWPSEEGGERKRGKTI